MSRKIIPLQSLSVAASTPTFIPASSRIHSVKGEADGKPTFDFIVVSHTWNGASDLTLSVKYAGCRNGRSVNLWNEWPEHVTAGATPATGDDTAIEIIPGTGVVLQVYYAQGQVST